MQRCGGLLELSLADVETREFNLEANILRGQSSGGFVLLGGLGNFAFGREGRGQIAVGAERLGIDLEDSAKQGLGFGEALLLGANLTEHHEGWLVLRIGVEGGPQSCFSLLKIAMCEF